MQETSSVTIIMATSMEADPFIETLDLKEIENWPFQIYGRDDLTLAISGIGKTSAAMTTAYICSNFNSEWILNLGAAGATDVSRELGSIYNIEKVIEPDRPHIRTNTPYYQIPDLLPEFQKAVLATQDKSIADINTFRELAPFADLVDMEGASVLQVSRKFKKRCLLFKFVSDTPVHAGQGERIMDNIREYREHFCRFICDSVITDLK